MAEAAEAGQLEQVISMVQLHFLKRSPSGRSTELLLGAGQLGVARLPTLFVGLLHWLLARLLVPLL